MKNPMKYIFSILLSAVLVSLSAQNPQVLYYMNLPQNHLLNPAMRPTNSLYIGLPGFSGIGINASNNFLNFSDLFVKGQRDSIMSFLHPDFDKAAFMSKIRNKNSIEPMINIPLFALGFTAGQSYIFLDINDRAEGNMVIPGDILRLGLQGNEQFVGSEIDLSSLRGDLKYYREAGIGFSRNFTNRLRLGFKAKMLMGIGAVSIRNNSLGITVNDDFSQTMNADFAMNFSGPFRAYMDKKGNLDSLVFDDSRFDGRNALDFLLKPKNLGLSLDLGAVYDLDDKLSVSAAITDIGYINWKNEPTNLKVNGTYHFDGFDVSNVAAGKLSFDSLASATLDSLKDAFVFDDSRDPFTTFQPFGVTFAGRYNLTRKFSVGLLSYSRFIGKQIREELTLSGNLNLGNALCLSAAYTAANHRFDNFGAGLAFRLGFFQFYAVADRLPLAWNRIKSEDGGMFPVPVSWNTVSARFGFNFVFGNRIKKKDDNPMVLVE
jgi:hypothetical protein